MSNTGKWFLGLLSSVVITAFGAVLALGLVTQKEMYDDLKLVKNEIITQAKFQDERYKQIDRRV